MLSNEPSFSFFSRVESNLRKLFYTFTVDVLLNLAREGGGFCQKLTKVDFC